MKNLMFSTVPALVVAVVLLAMCPVFSAGQNGGGINEPTVCQIVSCHQLDLAMGTTTADINEATITRFYLADFGGPFYIIHAILMPNPTAGDPDYKPIMMSGTGQVVESADNTKSGRVFYMNLHYSQEHTDKSPYSYWHDGRNAQVSLDLSTLKGTFWMVGANYNASNDEFADGFDKMDITLAGELPECLMDDDLP
jgi:hypothetical protein